jgi:WD40 repeat protein
MLIDRTLNPLTIGVDPNGNWVAASCAHTTLRIWDVRTGACLRIIDTAPPRVSAAALHPDGKRILLAAECLWVRDGCKSTMDRLDVRYECERSERESVGRSPAFPPIGPKGRREPSRPTLARSRKAAPTGMSGRST